MHKKCRPANNTKPWIHAAFTLTEKVEGVVSQCNYCPGSMSGTSVTRLKLHLLNSSKCQYLNSEEAKANTDPECQTAYRKAHSTAAAVAGPSSSHAQSLVSRGPAARGAQPKISQFYNTYSKEQLRQMDADFANVMFSANLPHNLVESPALRECEG